MQFCSSLYPTFEVGFSCFHGQNKYFFWVSAHCRPRTKKLISIKVRKLPIFRKNVLLNYYYRLRKKIRKIPMKSDFGVFWQTDIHCIEKVKQTFWNSSIFSVTKLLVSVNQTNNFVIYHGNKDFRVVKLQDK